MEAPRRDYGAAEAAAMGGCRRGYKDGGERPCGREPSVLGLSLAAQAPEWDWEAT